MKLNAIIFKYPTWVIVTVFALVIITEKSLQAQEIYDLSRCVVTGLKQNFSVKVVRNQEKISENNYTRGNAGFFPAITTTNRYGGNITSVSYTHLTLPTN